LPQSSTNPAALVYQPKADGRGAAEDCEFGPDRLEDERIRIHVSPGVGFLGRRGVSRGWTGAVEPRAFAATLASARYWPSVMVRRLLPSVSEIIQVQGRPMAGLLIYLILRDYRNPDAHGRSLARVLHAKWEHVDFERGLTFLPESKTGRKAIVLSAVALDV
jgi:hypothetical protein